MPTLLDLTDVSTLYCTAHVGLLADALPHFVLPHLKRVVAFTSTSIVTKRNSEIAEEREHVRHWEETEQQAVEVCERLGVVWTVLRPTMIYAEGRYRSCSKSSCRKQNLRCAWYRDPQLSRNDRAYF
jgi:hypothetical protein